jgi:hypothetical protein
MKTSAIILTLAGIGLAYLYFTSKNGRPRKDNFYEKPLGGKIIFTPTDMEFPKQDSLPQPPDINIILPK